MERERPRPQEFYRDLDNKLYQIITVAKHFETGEELIVYQALYGGFEIYVKPLALFMSEANLEKHPDAMQEHQLENTVSDAKKTDSQKEASPPVKTETDGELPNPDLLEFLDADTMEQKKRILIGMRDRITDRLIDDIAASLDVTIGKGEVSERYKSLMVCVDTMERFEVNRLR